MKRLGKAWQHYDSFWEKTDLGVGRRAWGPAANFAWVGGIGQGRGLKGIGCGLQEATSDLEVVVGRGVVLFLTPPPPPPIPRGKCEELEK